VPPFVGWTSVPAGAVLSTVTEPDAVPEFEAPSVARTVKALAPSVIDAPAVSVALA
jgi:hypothetical protein